MISFVNYFRWFNFYNSNIMIYNSNRMMCCPPTIHTHFTITTMEEKVANFKFACLILKIS